MTADEIQWICDLIGWRSARVVDCGAPAPLLAYEIDAPQDGAYTETVTSGDLREIAADLIRIADHLEAR